MNFISQIAWNMDGLIPAIAQDAISNKVLMMAWMNEEALQATVIEQRAVYWSRSRNKLWRTGEQSGNIHRLVGLHLDCDNDTILFKVVQEGGAAGTRKCSVQSRFHVCEWPWREAERLRCYPLVWNGSKTGNGNSTR